MVGKIHSCGGLVRDLGSGGTGIALLEYFFDLTADELAGDFGFEGGLEGEGLVHVSDNL